MELLKYPENYTSYFWDLPFCNPYKEFMKKQKAILIKREYKEFKHSWAIYEKDERIIWIRDITRELSLQYYPWPSSLFIPEDNLSIILGVIGSAWISIEPEDIAEDFINRFQILPYKNKLRKIIDKQLLVYEIGGFVVDRKKTFIDFICFIKDLLRKAGKDKLRGFPKNC